MKRIPFCLLVFAAYRTHVHPRTNSSRSLKYLRHNSFFRWHDSLGGGYYTIKRRNIRVYDYDGTCCIIVVRRLNGSHFVATPFASLTLCYLPLSPFEKITVRTHKFLNRQRNEGNGGGGITKSEEKCNYPLTRNSHESYFGIIGG